MQNLIDRNQMAEILGVNPEYLRYLKHHHPDFPVPVKKLSNKYLYLNTEVENYQQQHPELPALAKELANKQAQKLAQREIALYGTGINPLVTAFITGKFTPTTGLHP